MSFMNSSIFNHLKKLNYASVKMKFDVFREQAQEHFGGGWKLWKKMTFIVAFPAIGLGMVNAYLAHQEHAAHHERPEFVPFEYMRMRTKRFPWGDGQKSLFHNPHVNALPSGYEDH